LEKNLLMSFWTPDRLSKTYHKGSDVVLPLLVGKGLATKYGMLPLCLLYFLPKPFQDGLQRPFLTNGIPMPVPA
jgi:hypothetical protein